MRDEEQILRTLARLARVWRRNSALRLSQLIENVYHHADPDSHCFYYVGDDDFIARIESYYDAEEQSPSSAGSDPGDQATS